MSGKQCKKPCLSREICNPRSGRCVLKNGKIGKQLKLKSRDKSSRRKAEKDKLSGKKRDKSSRTKSKPRKVRSKNTPISAPIITQPTQVRLEDQHEIKPESSYISIKKIGEGVDGEVYLLCNGSGCIARKKIILEYHPAELFEHEVAMYKKFEKAGLAPKLYGYKIITNKKGVVKYGILDMEPISGTFEDLLKSPQSTQMLDWMVSSIGRIMARLCKYGLIHGDSHFGNFAYRDLSNGGREALFIDFGRSCCIQETKCNERLEYAKLLEYLNHKIRYSIDINMNNLKYLKNELEKTYNKKFHADNLKTTRDVFNEYDLQFQSDILNEISDPGSNAKVRKYLKGLFPASR